MVSFKTAYDFAKKNLFSIHFMAPLANWGFVIAGCNDLMKSPVYISEKMTTILFIYSFLFARFAITIRPKSYLLYACHSTNMLVQSTLLSRKLCYNYKQKQQHNGLQEVKGELINTPTSWFPANSLTIWCILLHSIDFFCLHFANLAMF